MRSLNNSPLNKAVIVLVSALLCATNIIAQADTSYADITILTRNANTNDFIQGVEVTIRPEAMQMVLMDTSYTLITNSNGAAHFIHIPMHIDTITSGIEYDRGAQIATSVGGEINITFPKFTKGTIIAYNINGQIIREESFSGNQAYMAVNDLATGIYFYQATSVDGNNITGKFLTTKQALKGKITAFEQNNTKATSL